MIKEINKFALAKFENITRCVGVNITTAFDRKLFGEIIQMRA